MKTVISKQKTLQVLLCNDESRQSTWKVIVLPNFKDLALNVFPLLCWNQLHCKNTEFLINQSLIFIEHLLIPRSWFGLRSYSIPRVCHVQNFPSTGIISGWVAGFHGCLNSPETTHNTEHRFLPSSLYPRSPSLILSCRHQGAALWAGISATTENDDVCLSACRALLLQFGCLSIPLQRSTLDISCRCVLTASRFLWIWVTQCKNNTFLEKGYLVGQNRRHRFLHTLTDLQLSSQSQSFLHRKWLFQYHVAKIDASPSNANYYRQFPWRMRWLEQTSVQLTRPRGHHSFLD